MPLRRKSRPTDESLDFEPIIRPRQRTYTTPRNRNIKKRGSTLSSKTTSQKTLTQIGYIPSSVSPHDDVALEYEEAGDRNDEDPSRRSKRRKTTPRDNTLTQIGYVSHLSPPEEDDGLDHQGVKNEELTSSPLNSPPSERRLVLGSSTQRHSSPKQPSIKTKRAGRRKGLNLLDSPGEVIKEETDYSKRLSPSRAALEMPPPRTPHVLRRREIPSSQSPADTPMSNRSRRSSREPSVSPLKERSVNVFVRGQTPLKSPRLHKTMEVADSVESLEDDSPVAIRKGKLKVSSETSVTTSIGTDTVSLSNSVASGSISRIPLKPPGPSSPEQVPARQSGNDSAGVNVLHGLSGSSVDKLRSDVGFHILSPQKGERSSPVSAIRPTADRSDVSDEFLRSNSNSSLHTNNARDNPSSSSSNLEDSLARPTKTPRLPTVPPSSLPLAFSSPQNVTTRKFSTGHLPQDADQTPTHFPYSKRTGPQLTLETDSQFESAWRPYSPQAVDEEGFAKYQSQLLLSPIHKSHSYFHLPSSVHHRTPVRPSQATTVDITQVSPRQNLTQTPWSHHSCRSQSIIQIPSSPPLPTKAHDQSKEVVQVPSSPPPQAPSSSPLLTKRAKAWDKLPAWDGSKLTDSQLLPESLLNDSLPGPPPLSEDDLEEM